MNFKVSKLNIQDMTWQSTSNKSEVSTRCEYTLPDSNLMNEISIEWWDLKVWVITANSPTLAVAMCYGSGISPTSNEKT